MRRLRKILIKFRKNQFFTTLFVGLALVFIWRGIWGILDYFFPQHDPVIYLIFIVIGVLLIWIDDFKIDEIRR